MCAAKKHTTTFCGECTENHCVECIDPRTRGELFIKHKKCHIHSAVGMVMGLVWFKRWQFSTVLWSFSTGGQFCD